MKKNIFSIGTFYKYFKAIQGEKVEISDEEFFQILTVWSDFLRASIAIERINHWQREVNSRDNDVSFNAEEKLKRIGTTLALKDRRTRLFNEKIDILIDFRRRALDKIKAAGISKCRNNTTKKARMKESRLFHPALVDKLHDIPNTNARIANLITACFFGYKTSTVERYIKGHAKMPTE